MKTIDMKYGYQALVSDEDYDRVSKIKWWVADPNNDLLYAIGYLNGRKILMHRFIMELQDASLVVDHINHNTLDNRRENLRVCNQSQNQANRIKGKGSSRFLGVYLHNDKTAWVAQIEVNDEQIYLGRYQTEEAAALARNKAAIKYFGEFANLNQLSNSEMIIARQPPKKLGISKYRGVSWYKKYNKWVVQLKHNKKSYFKGYFNTEEQAAKAYNELAVEVLKEKAKLNVI